MKEVILYSDGQYDWKKERGGWAVCLTTPEGNAKAWEGVLKKSSAPRLKMFPIAFGIEQLKMPCHVVIYTNVMFIKQVHDGLQNGSKKLEDQKHIDLWKRILSGGHEIEFRLYKGHGDTPEQKEMYGAANFNTYCSVKSGEQDAGYAKAM